MAAFTRCGTSPSSTRAPEGTGTLPLRVTASSLRTRVRYSASGLARGRMEGHIAGGFHGDAHTQLLTRLLAEVNLSPTWHQSADIRKLTAGALGIPPTHTPLRNRHATSLLGRFPPKRPPQRRSDGKGGRRLLRRARTFRSCRSDCHWRPDDELSDRCPDAISRSHRESRILRRLRGRHIAGLWVSCGPISLARSMVWPRPGRLSTHFWPSPSLLRR
ncbi:hypothetical protein MLGJGCBP_00895 [Rhodococcus sp. T7]|nr:hypothetical protein MLGJGCBP_09297 [Rhodococcus sp. T7]KAF0965952.1 hypothetical protein MLGJGCBP_00895 [Rhodococcus sp. T7]